MKDLVREVLFGLFILTCGVVMGILWQKNHAKHVVVAQQPAVTDSGTAPMTAIQWRDSTRWHDSTVIVKRLGGSVGDKEGDSSPAVVGRIWQPLANRDTFSLHLLSHGGMAFGLDSVTADYLYPSGHQQFSYFGSPAPAVEPIHLFSNQTQGLLRIGLHSFYSMNPNKLRSLVFLRIPIIPLSPEAGFYLVPGERVTWYIGAEVSRRVF